MKYAGFLIAILLVCGPVSANADEPRKIHVIVALCDNESQGIVPVSPKIGNGNDLVSNLYWGCSDGMKLYFNASKDWTLVESKKPDAGEKEPAILETLIYKHKTTGAVLTAEAWRGNRIRDAIQKFSDLLHDERTDLVAYIGHNGLMEFSVEEKKPATPRSTKKDAVVLCCKSDAFFKGMLDRADARPVLMTDQFMYPGSFILKAALDGWLRGESVTKIRDRAAQAYATNQKIKVSSARGVFTNLAEKKD